MDGKDYSAFSILPPFNILHAQLVNASTGKAVAGGVSLAYEAVADPTGSINTSSAGKTNFWSWSKALYGASPAPDVGLSGNSTPSRTDKPMTLDAANGWFEATALPITPYDDSGAKNYYPTVKVTARDGTGKVLATTTTVLPVSDEITCAACHASRPATEANPPRLAAKSAAGWVNDSNAETDWKKNILRLHDEKQAGNAIYIAALSAKGLPAGLDASALAGTPSLCASCHASNALPGSGITGVSALTSALHTRAPC
jgi:cytochrome c553